MRSSRALLLFALFALSGCGALVLETTWLRWFRLLFGATAPAAAATLVAFFAGQALGAALGARRLRGVVRPLRAWGVLEAVAALWALAVPWLLSSGESIAIAAYADLVDRPALLAALRLGVALVATLPTAICLGATLPAAGAALLADPARLGSGGAALYAAGLAGATVGAVLAATLLPDALGIDGTYGVGVALHAGVAAVVLLVARAETPRDLAPAAPEETRYAGELSPGTLPVLAAISGFGALAAQVLLVRALGLVLDQSVYAFAAVVVVVLASLAAGAAIASLLRRTQVAAPETLIAAGLAIGGLGLAAFPATLARLTDGLTPLAASTGAESFGAALRLVALSAGIPLLAAGLVLPALFGAAGREGGAAESHLGRLSAFNTVGAIAGALFAPFVLLAWTSVFTSFLVVALVWAAAAVFVPLANRRTRLRRDLALAFGWIVLVVQASPLDVPSVRLAPGERLEDLRSSAAGVVALVARDDGRLLRTDNHYSLGGSADRVHQERQGFVAALLHPGARRAAWIGSATGISAGALTVRPLEALTLVELMPGVAELAAAHFAAESRGVHADPRTRVVLDDARNHLRATADRFDLVVADLFVPWRAGTGSLYTREHFEAVRAHLAADGVFVQWLPLYQLEEATFRSVAATFLDAFPRTAVFRGDFFGRHPIAALVGFAGAPPSPADVARATGELKEAGVTDRWVTDPRGAFSLYVGPLGPLAASLAEVPRNTDARPRVEFQAAQSGTSSGLREPFVGRRWLRFVDELRSAAATAGDDVFPGLPEEARRAATGGALLQAASTHWTDRQPDEASRLLAAAAERLPPSLLDPAKPDPTAANVWPDAPR